MKKLVAGIFVAIFTIAFYSNVQGGCPSGALNVSASWFKPFNDTYYTMCNCSVVYGYDSFGDCTDMTPE